MFFLADIKRDGKNHTTILNDVISGCKDDIYFAEGYVCIKCYQSVDQAVDNCNINDDNTSIESLNNKKACDKIYLIFKSHIVPGELNFEELLFIRSILKYRYIICEELEKDIHSRALKELYQDDKWLDMFAQPKVVSHGQSEDIEKHLNNIENKFLLYQSYKNNVDAQYYDVYSDLTLFSNLLISFLYSKKIANDRALKYKFSEQLEITELKYIKTMAPRKALQASQKKALNFDDYSQLLKNENLYDLFIERFNYYVECLKRHGIKIDLIKDEINKIDSIISFQSSHQYSIWFSIAIIHILIKNAIQHGDKSEQISISMRRRDNSVDLIVKNKILNEILYSGKGITKKALVHAFENKPFSITFEKMKDKNEFMVKITNFFGGAT